MAGGLENVNHASVDDPASCPALLSADDRRNKESGDDKKPDFSALPSLLWVTIFSYLDQRARLALAMTCHTLHAIFMEPVLWSSTIIRIGGANPSDEVKLTPTDESVLGATCHNMKSVAVQIQRHWDLIVEKSSHDQICDAAAVWPMERLEVEIVSEEIKSYFMIHDFAEDLLYTCFTSINASGLSSLKIIAHDSTLRLGKPCLIEALGNSSFTSSLTNLYFGLAISRLENPDKLSEAIRKFEHLQYLTVRFQQLTNDLLNNLPKHTKEIHFIVDMWDTPKKISNWIQVLARFPQLIVGLEYDGTVPWAHVLPSYVPVSSARILYTSESDKCYHLQQKLFQILPMVHLKVLQCDYISHQSVLQCECQGSTHSLERLLIKAASHCPQMDHLDYHLCISSHTVITLARTRRWRKLEIDAASIRFSDSTDRNERLQKLSAVVSRLLGRDWKPRVLTDSLSDTSPSGIRLYFPTVTQP